MAALAALVVTRVRLDMLVLVVAVLKQRELEVVLVVLMAAAVVAVDIMRAVVAEAVQIVTFLAAGLSGEAHVRPPRAAGEGQSDARYRPAGIAIAATVALIATVAETGVAGTRLAWAGTQPSTVIVATVLD